MSSLYIWECLRALSLCVRSPVIGFPVDRHQTTVISLFQSQEGVVCTYYTYTRHDIQSHISLCTNIHSHSFYWLRSLLCSTLLYCPVPFTHGPYCDIFITSHQIIGEFLIWLQTKIFDYCAVNLSFKHIYHYFFLLDILIMCIFVLGTVIISHPYQARIQSFQPLRRFPSKSYDSQLV